MPFILRGKLKITVYLQLFLQKTISTVKAAVLTHLKRGSSYTVRTWTEQRPTERERRVSQKLHRSSRLVCICMWGMGKEQNTREQNFSYHFVFLNMYVTYIHQARGLFCILQGAKMVFQLQSKVTANRASQAPIMDKQGVFRSSTYPNGIKIVTSNPIYVFTRSPFQQNRICI